jgi:MFS family permease
VNLLLRKLGGRTFASLRRHRNYRLFFVGQVVSVSGTWMQNIAMYWLVLSLTHSPLAVGLLSIARFGPFTLFALFAGVIADRLDNRKTVMLTQSTQMVLAAGLTVLSFTGHVQAWQVDVIAFLGGTVLVLDAPARQGLTFQMVGRDELPNAVALNSTLFNMGRVAGPALAGAMIGAFGSSWCFAANAVSFLAVLTSLALMRPAEFFPLDRRGRPTILRGTREGLGFARRQPRIVAILLTTTVFATLLFNFNILLPVLAKQTLDQGPGVFGLIMSAFGAGALVGALTTAAIAKASWRIASIGATAFAVAEIVLAPLRAVWLVAALLFLIGIFFTIYTANANATVQLETPDHLRGRVLGIYYYAWNGLAPVGALLVGWLCEVGGTELAFLVVGTSGLASVAAAAAHLRRQESGVEEPAPSRWRHVTLPSRAR